VGKDQKRVFCSDRVLPVRNESGIFHIGGNTRATSGESEAKTGKYLF